jgi:hypothetical protein
MTGPTQETARQLLHRYGVPEDVIDGALCLYAQELAAAQRKDAEIWGVDTAAGIHRMAAADLIDPTRQDAIKARHDDEDHKPVWVTALDGDDEPARDAAGRTWAHCGICGTRREAEPKRCVGCGEPQNNGVLHGHGGGYGGCV